MDNRAKQQLVVWWAIWGAFQAGIFAVYFLLTNHAHPATATPDSHLWLIGIIPLALSAVLRWGILPLMPNSQTALVVFLVGIALAETCCFLGIFIFPAHRLELFILSVIGIFQFIPLFASRFFSP